MGDLSLLSGWLVGVVIVVAAVSTVLCISWRDGRWRRELVIGGAVAIGLSGGVALADQLLTIITFTFPKSFYAYAALAIFALTVTVLGFRRDSGWQRLSGVVAVVSTAMLLGLLVNDQYQYYPTLANLFGKVADNQKQLPQLAEIKEQVRQTGQLPTAGVTVEVPIPGKDSGFTARDGYVYLPPAYFADPEPKLPVLLLLHGVPGAPADWSGAGGADKGADGFAPDHDGRAPILVMPDVTGDDLNDTECTDSPRGKVETYLVDDVPAYVRETFGVAPDDPWGVAGLSLGGFCSLMLPLRHPTQFIVFGAYSGLAVPTLDPPDSALSSLFGGDQQAMDAYDPTKILATKRFEGLSGWFEVGTDDSDPLRETKAVAAQASSAGMATCVLIRPGSHDFNFWHASFEHSLPWLSARLGLVPLPVDIHGADCSGG